MKTNLTFSDLKNIAATEIGNFTDLEQPDLRLEEVEYNKDSKFWEIVVSFLVKSKDPHVLSFIAFKNELEYNLTRLYKKIKIDNNSNILGVYIYDRN